MDGTQNQRELAEILERLGAIEAKLESLDARVGGIPMGYWQCPMPEMGVTCRPNTIRVGGVTKGSHAI